MDPQKEKRLLSEFQRGFPLVEEPYAEMARILEASEAEILTYLTGQIPEGTISRIGPVIAPGKTGVSTLAAIQVPTERLESVAELVSSYPEVNHNYQREDALNLWFVVHASDETHLQRVLGDMQTRSGLQVHDLRLEEEFRIDLAFEMFEESSP